MNRKLATIAASIAIAGSALSLTACSQASTPAPVQKSTVAAPAAPKTDPACAQWAAVQDDVDNADDSATALQAAGEVKGLENVTTDPNLESYLAQTVLSLDILATAYDSGLNLGTSTDDIATAANSVSDYCTNS